MTKRSRHSSEPTGGLDSDLLKSTSPPSASLRAALYPAIPSIAYDTFWHLAAERQRIFFRKLSGQPAPWTTDPILNHYKFTNAYRASDRVSQYLIREVIYNGPQEPIALFFRIILFKLFNRISTWQHLTSELGPIHPNRTSLTEIDNVLSNLYAQDKPLYSAAYIIPPPQPYDHTRKHRNHLSLLAEMLSNDLHHKIHQASSMEAVFNLLKDYPSIGDFLAYQFTIDLNYSPLIDFSEMDFIAAGPGAKSGIAKCFKSLGGMTEEDIITLATKRQTLEFDRLDIDFASLWGRPLQLVDCQNLFCEVDKYSRIAHPELTGTTERSTIKQTYSPCNQPISYTYPPNWDLNVAPEWSNGM